MSEASRCCACGCVDSFCEGGPECMDPEEGFPLCRRFYGETAVQGRHRQDGPA